MSKLISHTWFLLLVTTLLAVWLRFYLLVLFPVQLNHDEVTQLYDAISIAQTGKDIYGNFLPVIFPSVQDFKPPFYTYITSVTYLLFGDREVTIKIPAALFGALMPVAVFLFVKQLMNDQLIAIFSAFATAISPSEIFFSRKSFENGAGIFFLLLGLTFALAFLKIRTKRWLLLAATFLALGMYTYFSHAVVIPLLSLSFLWIFSGDLKIIKRYRSAFIFGLLLISPLIIIIFTSTDSRLRSSEVFVTKDPSLGRQIEVVQGQNSPLSYLLKYKTITDYSFSRYLNQFNITYLFSNGLDLTSQGFMGSGPLLLIQLPLVILGAIFLIKHPMYTKQSKFLFAWIIVGIIPSGLTFEEHSPHRVLMVFTALNILTGVGCFVLVQEIQSLTKRRLKITKFISMSFLPLLIVDFIYFTHLYFINYPYEKSEHLHYPFKQVAEFASSQQLNFGQIVFDPQFGEIAPVVGTAAHYYFAYYSHLPPATMQKEYKVGEKEREVLFRNYSIRKVDWLKDQTLTNTLLIVSPWSVPIDSIDKNKIIKTFYFYDGKPAFYAISIR